MEGISTQDYLNNLSKSFPNCHIMVSGRIFDENESIELPKMLFCSNLTNNLKMSYIVLTLHLMHTNLIKLFIVSCFFSCKPSLEEDEPIPSNILSEGP